MSDHHEGPPGAGGALRRGRRVAYREIDDGQRGVLLHLDTGAYHSVNRIGALVWSLLDGVTLEELMGRLRERLTETPVTLEEEVAAFLRALEDRDLIERDQP
ncbi:MAG: PqqD family protein [Thermoleophilaceae bacterium]